MGLTVKKPEGSGGNPVSQGLHQAVAFMLYDLGTHYNEKFGKSAHKILIGWEVPSERIEVERDGQKVDMPKMISSKFTASLHEKAQLRKTLESWRGRNFTKEELAGFNMQSILKANCMLNVIHNQKDGKNYANVAGVVQLPKGMKRLEPENPIRYFSFEEHLDSIPDGTPDWIKDIIKASEEWQGMNDGGIDERNNSVGSSFEDGDPGPADDDIPF
jgi:hypothetical protein